MEVPGTVLAAYARSVVEYGLSRGCEAGDLAKALRQSPDWLDAADRRIPGLLFHQLLELGAMRTDDPNFGLNAGAGIKPGHYGVLGHLAMSCETLGQALTRHMKYQSLVATLGTATVRPGVEPGPETGTETGLRLAWETGAWTPARHIAEHNAAGWVCYARWITGRRLNPTAVRFRHAAPADTTVHRRLFGCPIHFDTPGNVIDFPADFLRVPLLQHDDGLREQMDRYADRLLEHLTDADGVVARVRQRVAQRLSAGRIDIADIAGELGMTTRTLQRRLAAEESRFADLVDAVRRESALRALDEGTHSLAEVAFLVGFSDQSAFQRAFRRWTGSPPGAFRQSGSG